MARNFTIAERAEAWNVPMPADRAALEAWFAGHYQDGCVRSGRNRYVYISPEILAV